MVKLLTTQAWNNCNMLTGLGTLSGMHIRTSVIPNGMLPTYSRRACRVIWLPTTGTGVGVTAKPSGVMVGRRAVAGICPAAREKIQTNNIQKRNIGHILNLTCCVDDWFVAVVWCCTSYRAQFRISKNLKWLSNIGHSNEKYNSIGNPRLSPCMALYCMGVMCSKPGGGTSQYFLTFFFFSRCGERLQDEDKTGKINKEKKTILKISHQKSNTPEIPMMAFSLIIPKILLGEMNWEKKK